MVQEIDYNENRRLKIIGNPIKMSEIEREEFKAPPKLGEDTEQILKSILHYSSDKIDQLRQQSVI
jgi:crotonobetainyl-CoA:carnitine CoA-transferase CaiB-like acyl-CoA transferase